MICGSATDHGPAIETQSTKSWEKSTGPTSSEGKDGFREMLTSADGGNNCGSYSACFVSNMGVERLLTGAEFEQQPMSDRTHVFFLTVFDHTDTARLSSSLPGSAPVAPIVSLALSRSGPSQTSVAATSLT